jgi:hypothetical protein
VTQRENGHRDQPEPTVVLPDDPPLLTPPAAAALLRLLRHASAQDTEAPHAGSAQMVPFPARNSDDRPGEHGRKAA